MLSADAVSAGPFYWESPATFVAGMAGLFLVALGWLLLSYRPASRRVAHVVLHSGILLVAAGAFSAQLLAPVAVRYYGLGERLNPPDLDRAAQAHARQLDRPVLYYFRADWCAHCPEFERYRLMSPLLAETLKGFVVVRMDLTDFARWKSFAEDAYGVHGTPTLAFRDRQGRFLNRMVVEGDDLSVAQIRSLLLVVDPSTGGQQLPKQSL